MFRDEEKKAPGEKGARRHVHQPDGGKGPHHDQQCEGQECRRTKAKADHEAKDSDSGS